MVRGPESRSGHLQVNGTDSGMFKNLQPNPTPPKKNNYVPDVSFTVIASAQSGGPEAQAAWEEIVNTYNMGLFKFFRKVGIPTDDIEDCNQRVWERIVVNLPKYKFMNVPFSNWLFKAASWVLLDNRRRIKTRSEYEKGGPELLRGLTAEHPFETPEESQDYTEGTEAFSKLIANMPDQYQTKVLDLMYRADLTPDEISKKLDIPKEKVYTLSRDAKKAMKRRLKGQ